MESMRVAVTGGIGEGKSTVLAYLREAGYATDSADDIARQVILQPPVQALLLERVGATDAAAVRERLADDPDFRRDLNALMHPSIADSMIHSTAQFLEVPLLIEACLQSSFSQVWVVTCGSDLQLSRLVSRLGNLERAAEMLRTQLPTCVKIPFADTVVRTNCDEESVRAYVIEAAQKISQ